MHDVGCCMRISYLLSLLLNGDFVRKKRERWKPREAPPRTPSSLTGKACLRLEPQVRRDFLHRHAGGVDDGKLVVLEQPLGCDDFLVALLETGVAAAGVACLADGGEAFRRQGQGSQPGQ